MSKSILVIPDSHVRPGVSLRRFKWLAKFIKERDPDYIVHLGDLFDMESLCSYDAKTLHAENRRYKHDVQSGRNALYEFSFVSSKAKKFFLIGNHEQRIERACTENPALADWLSYDDLGLKMDGWEMVPFLQPKELCGIFFSHYFISGVMGRPIGGENAAANMLRKTFVSCVAGHSHLYDYSERSNVLGHKIQALVAGCFLDPAQRERYAGPANSMWRNAISYLHNCKNGNFDLETISIERLREMAA